MQEHAIEHDVRSFLDENFMLDVDTGTLSSEASLTGHGVLDSMGVLELIAYLEERFDITIPDEDTLPENLDSIARIVRYVEQRSNGQAS